MSAWSVSVSIIAAFRSEGAGEAAKIIGKKERDLQEIESEAYKTVQEIYGEADAKASAIYRRPTIRVLRHLSFMVS